MARAANDAGASGGAAWTGRPTRHRWRDRRGHRRRRLERRRQQRSAGAGGSGGGPRRHRQRRCGRLQLPGLRRRAGEPPLRRRDRRRSAGAGGLFGVGARARAASGGYTLRETLSPGAVECHAGVIRMAREVVDHGAPPGSLGSRNGRGVEGLARRISELSSASTPSLARQRNDLPRSRASAADFFTVTSATTKTPPSLLRALDWVIDCAANPSVLAGVAGGTRPLVSHNLGPVDFEPAGEVPPRRRWGGSCYRRAAFTRSMRSAACQSRRGRPAPPPASGRRASLGHTRRPA